MPDLSTTRVLISPGLEGLADLIGAIGFERLYLVVDSRVMSLWGDVLLEELRDMERSGLHAVDALEERKSVDSLRVLWNDMAAAGLRRDADLVVVLGGGLTCDLGAMAASTYLRGLHLLLLPSSLLCQVDACLGGKTGVNLGGAKNQLGTFHPADMVWAATGLLRTLEEDQLRNGLGEVLKTSVLGDAGIARDLLGRRPPRDDPSMPGWASGVVARCLAIKGGIVELDVRERAGVRRLLNLGHTMGHALESASGFRLGHGEAVAAGLVLEARMAESIAGIGPELSRELEGLVRDAVGMDTSAIAASVSPREVAGYIERDKKTGAAGSRIWVLPFGWEDCRQVRLEASRESVLVAEALGQE